MIRRIAKLALTIMFLSCMGLYADEAKVELLLELPDDYGINFPARALRLDHFFVAVSTGADEYSLVADSGFNAVAEWNSRGELRFTLLYYGNLSEDYIVRISADPVLDFVGFFDGEPAVIPSQVSIEANAETADEVEVIRIDDSVVDVFISANGARRGEPVADVVINWETREDTHPGIYSAELVLSLSAI